MINVFYPHPQLDAAVPHKVSNVALIVLNLVRSLHSAAFRKASNNVDVLMILFFVFFLIYVLQL